MRIGELARRAGTSPRALRHYEDAGLLAARRRSNGYREFDEHDLRLVAEIRSLLAIGFTLAETRPFVDCLRAGNDRGVACPDAAAVYRRKIAEIDACTARLAEIRAGLVGQLTDELASRDPVGRDPVGRGPVGRDSAGRDPVTRVAAGRDADGLRSDRRSATSLGPEAARAVPVPDAPPACALSLGKNQFPA
jgi:DNA-binding transcriptional MerR regulator